MPGPRLLLAPVALTLATCGLAPLGAVRLEGVPRVEVETLTAVDALPAHITGRFQDPIAFVAASTGQTLVLDRRGHTVYVINRARTSVTKVLEVGFEAGRVLSPGALSIAPNDIFAVADAPNQYERIQYFGLDGQSIGAFYLDERRPLAPRLTLGPLVLNGVGSMQFTGRTFLVNAPDAGALITEIDNRGAVLRRFGTLRTTGFEQDPNVHLAMNVGVPLVDPTGGYFFVFQTGVPAYRKYDAAGQLLYERHVEGPELDGPIQALPTTWPTRETGSGRLPLVEAMVRTAAVDAGGRLWISLMAPVSYVYDSKGDKVRTLRFRSASGVLSPGSLFFAPTGRLLVTPGCYEFDPG